MDLESSSTALTIIKGLSSFALFVIAIIFGFGPVKSTRFRKNPKLIGYCSCFSAGVFLGMGLLHLLFESEEDWKEYKELESPGEKSYPFPILITIISFSTILMIEKVLFSSHDIVHSHEDHEENEEENDEHSILQHQQDLILKKRPSWPCHPMREENNFKRLVCFQENVAKRLIDNEKHKNFEIDDCVDCQTGANDQKLRRAISSPGDQLQVRLLSSEKEPHKHPQNLGPYIILLALSLHGVFEGIAIGIQNSPKGTFNFIIAVLLHKWAEALTLGVALVKGKVPSKSVFIQMLIFSLAGPIGIGIGWAVSDASLLVSSIFKAISAGTFLYISTSELIVEEFNVSFRLGYKFLLYSIGIIVMALLLLMD